MASSTALRRTHSCGENPLEAAPPESLRIEPVESAAAIDREAWARLAPPGDPFLNRDFLAIVERHGAAGPRWGWQARHLVARDGSGTIAGILPLYRKFNSYGDFTGDWSWASAWQQLGLAYYPKHMSGMPHTPAGGPRLLAATHAVGDALTTAAIALTAEEGLSSWHLALPDAAEIEALLARGLLLSHDVQYHWRNDGYGDFDGFLRSLTAEKRRKLRAERRRVAESGLRIELRHGDEIATGEWTALHALYAATFERFDNHAVFTADCFAELASALGPRMLAFIARDGRTPVAVSLCFRSDDVLYGRYWGCRERYNSLHFELCFHRGIDYCLQHGLSRFEPGAGGEHKIARGFVPTLVSSAHWIAEPRLRGLLARHLERQRQAVEAYRVEAASHVPFRAPVPELSPS